MRSCSRHGSRRMVVDSTHHRGSLITSSNLVTTASLQVRRSAPIPSLWVSEHRLETMIRFLKDHLLRQHVEEGISFQSRHSRRHVIDIVRRRIERRMKLPPGLLRSPQDARLCGVGPFRRIEWGRF